jgi:hypothetical protein
MNKKKLQFISGTKPDVRDRRDYQIETELHETSKKPLEQPKGCGFSFASFCSGILVGAGLVIVWFLFLSNLPKI